MLNILNGGKHADNTVDFQEFMIQPWGFDDFHEALRAGVEIYHTLKKVLKERGMSTAVGDEGGFAPNLKDNEDALKVIEEAVDKAGYKWGEQIFVALDPATSELWNEAEKDGKRATSSSNPPPGDHLVRRPHRHLGRLVQKYPIRSIEDGLAENDWEGLGQAHRQAGRQGPARRRRPVRHQQEVRRARRQGTAPPTPSSSRSTRSARSAKPSTP
jgi:enolase